jgi:hypothetical protein
MDRVRLPSMPMLRRAAAVAEMGSDDRSGESAGQGAAVAPDWTHRHIRFLGFDGQAWIQLIGGLVIGLIALYSSYDHINLGSRRFSLNQQWGIWCIITSLAVVASDAQLATRSRRREKDRRIEDTRTAAEERGRADQERDRGNQEQERAAQREAAQLQRSRVEAQASRAQLEQALIMLSSPEGQALYDDELLERWRRWGN